MLAFYSHIPAWLSVILVPAIAVLLFIVLKLLIKNRGGGVGVSKLNKTLEEADSYIKKNKADFNKKNVKALNKKLKIALACCDFIESEELYELDSAVSCVKKASKIAKAVLVADTDDKQIPYFADIIAKELEHARFSLAAVYSGNKNKPDFTVPGDSAAEEMKELLSRKKKAEKAQNYLDSLK